MTLKELFEASSVVIAKKAKENPTGTLRKGDVEFTYQELSRELKNVASWCYKGEMDTINVIRCKNCKNYKLYRKKNNPKDKGQKRCRLDKEIKRPEHYCAFGEKQED